MRRVCIALGGESVRIGQKLGYKVGKVGALPPEMLAEAVEGKRVTVTDMPAETKFDALPAKMRAIIENAVEAASQDLTWKAIDRYSQDYIELKNKQGVKFYKTPDSVLTAQLKVWDSVAEKKSAENPLFKKINDSQRAFAQRAVRWQQDTMVGTRMAYNHFFAKKG